MSERITAFVFIAAIIGLFVFAGWHTCEGSSCPSVGDVVWCSQMKGCCATQLDLDEDGALRLGSPDRKMEVFGKAAFWHEPNSWDCEFDLQIRRGLADTVLELTDWKPDQYGLSFNARNVRLIVAGRVQKQAPVPATFAGSDVRSTLTLTVGPDIVRAALDGKELLSAPRSALSLPGNVSLTPRINTDVGDELTIYATRCNKPPRPDNMPAGCNLSR